MTHTSIPVSDSASAAYADQEEKYQQMQDSLGEAKELASMTEDNAPPPPVCSQCVNWRAAKLLRSADGTTGLSPGFCTTRAAADLPQMSLSYTSKCLFFEVDIPF